MLYKNISLRQAALQGGTQGNGEIFPVREQLSLFSNPLPAPEGLRYQPDFISE